MSQDIFVLKKAANGAEYLNIPKLDDNYPVRTFFSTKNGGVSTGAYASQNMGFSTDDAPENVEINRKNLFSQIGAPGYILVRPVQVHSCSIAVVTGDGSADLPENRILNFPDTDASITDCKNVILSSLHADCLPVWLYDRQKNTAGLAHAGWRGTRADIAALTARKMCEVFGGRMEDITAVIGPGISKCCFEVGAEVYEDFKVMLGKDLDVLAEDDKNGKYHLDLKGINKILLQRAGVGEILVSDYCTVCCEEDIFYSYRRDGGVTGRMCAGICLL